MPETGTKTDLLMLLAISGGRSHRLVACFATVALFALGRAAAAQDAAPSNDAAKFCANIGDAASDARIAWQARTLNDLKAQVEAETTALDAKRAELEDWVKRREDFRKLAEGTIVDIYAKMRPEAAATQLAALDPEMAAAVLVKLNARVAGAIMAEMDTPRAVSLAALISAGATPEPTKTAQQ